VYSCFTQILLTCSFLKNDMLDRQYEMDNTTKFIIIQAKGYHLRATNESPIIIQIITCKRICHYLNQLRAPPCMQQDCTHSKIKMKQYTVVHMSCNTQNNVQCIKHLWNFKNRSNSYTNIRPFCLDVLIFTGCINTNVTLVRTLTLKACVSDNGS
jgi:hypothetical protein